MSISRISQLICIAWFSSAVLCPCVRAEDFAVADAKKGKVPFADVRRVLSDKCFHCHGPDAANRQGNLRLDDRESAVSGGDSGPALVPGDSKESLLYQRITAADPSERMPPADATKQLDASEVELIRQWLEQGAEYQSHWAFKPIVRPSVPSLAVPAHGNAIDTFVLDKLQAVGLSPNPRADRHTLVRRLCLDLVGLLPTPEQVERYVASEPTAPIEQLVDELLASPQFGEKWGREWLDGARYADSDGFEKDKPRSVWFYRDWVVRAHNSDKPYNQFIIEQLAGDMLPGATQDQRVATGFLRNSMINEEGGVDPEQFRMEAMFDRMDAIGKSILGLTLGCGQCHDHKFDPISQEDYYRIFAFFNRSAEGSVPVFTPEQQKQRASILQRLQAIDEELMHGSSDIDRRVAEWESTVRGNQPDWSVARLEWNDNSLGGCKMLPQGDGSYLAQSYAPTKSEMWGSTKVESQRVTALKLECLTDPNLPMGGPGRSIFGYGALSEIRVYAAPADKPEQKSFVKIASATADLNPDKTLLPSQFDDRSGKKRWLGPIEYAIDGANETAWSLNAGPGLTHQSRNAVFVFEQPIENAQGTILYVHIVQNHGGWNSDDNQNCNLGRIRFSTTDSGDAKADLVPREVRNIIESVPWEQRTQQQRLAVFAHWRSMQSEFQQQNDEVARLWSQYPEPISQLVYQEQVGGRTTQMLDRGDFLKPTRLVSAGVPSFLHRLKTSGDEPTRLDFARWTVDDQSPLAARVIANRVWQSLFGVGLTSTSEDFGSQSELPTHPELLDHLAASFMEDGWSMKRLLRLIVTSATYQQASQVTADHQRIDPLNRLLARSPRVRVMGEGVRDLTLAASGLMDFRLAGPPVFPPAPDFLFQPPVSYGPKVWSESQGGQRYRRSLYIFRFRSVPYPVLQVFDTPNGDSACVRRSVSNTPLQALTALNESVFNECAQSLSRLAFIERSASASHRERMEWMGMRVLQRSLTENELAALEKLWNSTWNKVQDESIAKQVCGWDAAALNSIPKSDQSPQVLAAWTAVSRVLLNLDETITKE